MAGTAGTYQAPAAVPRPVWRGTAVTNAQGIATFTYPPGRFTAPPVVAVAVQGGTGNLKAHRVLTNTTASATVLVQAAAGVTVVGIGVLATAQPEAGATVHLHAGDAG